MKNPTLKLLALKVSVKYFIVLASRTIAIRKFSLLLIAAFLCTMNVYSQVGGQVWYFGNNAGIDFSSGTPVALSNGKIYADEGASSISDCQGKLLSYSDGVTVYDAAHNIMPNGTGLKGHS